MKTSIIMKISKIEVHNFRLLKNLSLDLEDDLSLVIGKNNSGKTSLLSAMEKFINSNDKSRIVFDDFNVELRQKLCNLLHESEPVSSEGTYVPMGMQLRLFLTYNEQDNLGQISHLIMSLDPHDNNIVLSFEYLIGRNNLVAMKQDYFNVKSKYDGDPLLYLSENHYRFFGGIIRKSLLSSDYSIFTDLTKEKISLSEVISFKSISAKRSVTNRDNDRTLSTQTSTIYRKTEETEEQKEAVEEFRKTLRDTDKDLSAIYGKMFSRLLGNIKIFGGFSESETSIRIASTLQHRELLDGNTTVMYKHDAHDLPEHFNGLGYMNLISMIFEIDLLMTSFRKPKNERPAAINLLFIEEPEAHTHPQMQYVFIKNIKLLLQNGCVRDDGLRVNLQTVISTHSSHIVSESNFDDIKYLRRINSDVTAKNLRSLHLEYDEDAAGKMHYRFLKQYLTLNKAELFFADKAILMEGDTERILIPAMMKKLDIEMPSDKLPLNSQNVTLIEVGAHSQIFEKLISFLGIRTLIITDIDTGFTLPVVDAEGNPVLNKDKAPKTTTEKCQPLHSSVDHTSNNALTFYFGKSKNDIKFFLDLKSEQKTLLKNNGVWQHHLDGNLRIAYQTQQESYRGRSFEDAFFSINKDFLGDDAERFPSLIAKHFDIYIADNDAYKLSENGVSKKTGFAIEVLLNSDDKFSNWKTPAYIEEGLAWLRN